MEQPGPEGRTQLRILQSIDALVAAPRLLGALLERTREDGRLQVGRIVEVEAYLGAEDAASHAARGPTPRSSIMFEEGGRAYVYLSYGMHHCLNVVCGPRGLAGAVLIRALEPLEHIAGSCSGPGRLCRELSIDRRLNGHDLERAPLRLRLPRTGSGLGPGESVATGPRIGIRLATELPWRFWIEGHPDVSRARASSRSLRK